MRLTTVCPQMSIHRRNIDDVLSTLERQGIEIYEDLATANAAGTAANLTEGPESDRKEELAAEAGLDLSFGVDPKSQDPVRIYSGRWAQYRCSPARAR